MKTRLSVRARKGGGGITAIRRELRFFIRLIRRMSLIRFVSNAKVGCMGKLCFCAIGVTRGGTFIVCHPH